MNNNYHEFKFTNKTNCLSLQKGSDLIETKFYNQYTDIITLDQLAKDAQEIAKENNLKEYSIDFTDYKEVFIHGK